MGWFCMYGFLLLVALIFIGTCLYLLCLCTFINSLMAKTHDHLENICEFNYIWYILRCYPLVINVTIGAHLANWSWKCCGNVNNSNLLCSLQQLGCIHCPKWDFILWWKNSWMIGKHSTIFLPLLPLMYWIKLSICLYKLYSHTPFNGANTFN
jgi:hypothetical protein